MSKTLPVRRLEPGALMPTRAHADDAGLDLYALEDVTIDPGAGTVLRTGVAVAVAHGHAGLILDRSSLARRGLKIAGGVVDSGYRGEIGIVVWNLSHETQDVKKGERAAQMLVIPIAMPAPVETADLGETKRGVKGFGSTGR